MNNEDLVVIETTHGKGILAGRDFKKEEVIMEFHGPRVSGEEIPNDQELEGHYVQIGDNLYMGPSGGLDDLVNHSCDPNTGLVMGDEGIFLKAIKDIKKGEELGFDYSTTMDDEWTMSCNCGKRECRGTIGKFKDLSEDLQEKYHSLGIVAPYLLKK